ncbi:MAG: ABC transporter ATP-binding protein [Dehalogenimonas sp.]|jgi:tungstate transport system ATP-binding protein|uniref:ABC transporter ATP-binding protein n=1 Tax=Candidatus Dehalogenimonas loeffleri TaxID=3127115 RepID=A0ABZ2J3T9_9CHLR|nr:ABC transporter ATP-binding protein [Dehalogenimonas sp.]
MPIIETSGLTQSYNETTVLRDVDLKVEPGETLGIIGPSGAGKSTLIRLLDLLEIPSSGSISIFNQTVNNKTDRLPLRRRMAFVHQKPLVFTTSVFDNVAQPLRWRGIKKDVIKAQVHEALALVKMDAYINRHAKTLSGGETQRVALARALVTRPELLFLDEPTANLDPQSTVMVEELISSVIQARNLTVVMTTHDLAQGQRLADRIGVLVAGKLLQLGQAQEIFMAPACRAVAEFIGVENILSGTVTAADNGLFTVAAAGRAIQAVGDFKPGDTVDLFIRPEDIVISVTDDKTSARNHFAGTITRLSLVSPLVRLELDADGLTLMAVVTQQAAADLELVIGKLVFASLKATAIHAARGVCLIK